MKLESIERRIRTRHLIAFLEVARTGAIVSAAANLGVSQPAMTRSIQELETLLRVVLFDRSRNGVTLTPYGQSFLQFAQGSIAHLREGIAELVSTREGRSGSLKVGVLPTASTQLLPLAIQRLKAARSNISIMLSESTINVLLSALKAGDLDLIVGRKASPDEMTNLSFEQLYTERMCVVARPGHPAASSRKLSSLMQYPWILPPTRSLLRREAEILFTATGEALPRDQIDSAAYRFNRSYVMKTDALCIAPWGVYVEEIRAKSLVEIRIDMSVTASPIGITSRASSRPTPLVAAFRSELRRAVTARVQPKALP